MPEHKKNNTSEERLRRDYKFDRYTLKRLKLIMDSNLFRSEAEAVRTAIYILADKIERGEFSDDGATRIIE